MFSNGSIRAWPERARKLQAVGSAVHNVLERIEVVTPDGPAQAWALATNVYHRTAQGWRMVAHHASAGTSSEIQEVSGNPQVLH
jgi:ketosteroid isomerase-like protein